MSKLQFLQWNSDTVFNKYVFTILLFILWMLLFDRHNYSSQNKLSNEVIKLAVEKEMYVEKLKEITIVQNNLDQDLERLAREKYYMHKPNEKLFLIEK